MARWTLVCSVVVAALGTLAATAFATIRAPGPNGPFVFTSGRGGPDFNDDNAKIWVTGPFGGPAVQVTFGDTRHSHPNWSPDRTRIVYSKSVTGAGPRDLWVRDLVKKSEVRITNSVADEDRGAWSPDGTKIAYGSKVGTGQSDIYVFTVGGTINSGANVTNTATVSEDKPAWTPDGQEFYYARDPSGPAFNDTNDIYRKPATAGGGAGDPVVATAVNEWQPAVSPDGLRLCYSAGGMSDGGAGDVDVNLANTNGINSNITFWKASAAVGEFNCVWSPDGTQIGYVEGVFSNGKLMRANADGSGGSSLVANDVLLGQSKHFDGNPDWTYNPSPTCIDGAASVAFNSFVQIALTCTDAGDPPDYDPGGVDEEIATPPTNGVLGGLQDEMVIYTPNADFRGSDSFTFKGSDGTSDSSPARVDITVEGPGAGGGPPGAANVNALSVSPKRFRRGRLLPVASQTPVGTTIGVTLSARGQVKLTFRRARPGRRVRGRCVKPTRQNRNRRRCRRYVKAGTLSFDGKQGTNTLRFQGRLTRRKTLPIGRYRVAATVTANGRTSPRRVVAFRIVRR
ncbi:MAG TPA: Ig-like domain-containing protein [Thermoleophilaceae bacterium]|nr:Ig-like domain-containing protein [Thermoleophilaceae bacterium]